MNLFWLGLLLLFPRSDEEIRARLLQGLPSRTPAPFALEDRAIGFSDAGQVENVTTNWGFLSGVHFYTPAIHWPRNAPFEHQYCYGLILFVGTRDNLATIHNRFIYDVSDWEPLEGSLGRLHSGDVVNPDGWPIMATSSDTLTWPKDPSGRRFWPGPFRRDPLTGEVVPGEFVSDQDIYCAYDDRLNPKGPMGLEVHQIGYSYGRFYAEDFIFYRLRITNTSDSLLDSLYAGFFAAFRVDFDFQDLIGLTDATDTLGFPNLVYVYDADNTPDPPWESVGPIGLAFVETPLGTGITDFHYFDKEFDPSTDEELWPVVSSNPEDPDINPEHYFHGPNRRLDETPPSRPGAYDFIAASGPFSLAPGDTVELSIAVVLGDDLEDLLDNARTAFRMREKYYQGPSGPPAPQVRAFTGDGFVRLYWDPDPSETTPDPFLGILDFEGYKIYRSDDGGLTWGEPIYDPEGNLRGYRPLAVFDLVDGIRGVDPANPYQSLGGDVGLAHSFVDSTVINGVRYLYAVTAFDRGNPHPDSLLPSMESPIGRLGSPNVVEVIPGPKPTGWTPTFPDQDTLQPVNGLTDALVAVQVLDPEALTGHPYELRFDSLGGVLVFTLLDLETGDTLLLQEPLPDSAHLDGLPVVDGFRLILRNTPWGFAEAAWDTTSPTDFDWFVEDRGRGEAVWHGLEDFVVVVDPDAATPAPVYRPRSVSRDTPFVRVDTTFLLPLRAYRITHPEAPEPVDSIVAVDPYYLYPDTFTVSPPGWDLIPGGAAWPRSATARDRFPDQIGLFKDSTWVFIRTLNGPREATPPEPGDSFFVRIHKPLRAGLIFRFTPTPPAIESLTPLRVRVVPNPFVLQSGFETTAFERKLMFTGLPPKCEIRIYNIAGDLIAVLEHEDDRGFAFWDLKTRHGLDVSYGLYLYVVRTPDGREARGRFAVIR